MIGPEVIKQSPSFFWRDPNFLTLGAERTLKQLPDLKREQITFDSELPFPATAALLTSAEKLLVTMMAGKEPFTTSGIQDGFEPHASEIMSDSEMGRGSPYENLMRRAVKVSGGNRKDPTADLMAFPEEEGVPTAFFIKDTPTIRRTTGPTVHRLAAHPNSGMPNGNLLASALAVAECRDHIQTRYGVGVETLVNSEFGRNSNELARLDLLQRINKALENAGGQHPDGQFAVRDIFPLHEYGRDIFRRLEELADIQLHGSSKETQLFELAARHDYQFRPGEKAVREYEVLEQIGFYDQDHDPNQVQEYSVIFANPAINEEGILNPRRIMTDTISQLVEDGPRELPIDEIMAAFRRNLVMMDVAEAESMTDSDVRLLVVRACKRKEGFDEHSPFEIVPGANGKSVSALKVNSKILVINDDQEMITNNYHDLNPEGQLRQEWRRRVVEEWMDIPGNSWMDSTRGREIYTELLAERGQEVKNYEDHYAVRTWTWSMDRTGETEPQIRITPQQQRVIGDVINSLINADQRYQELVSTPKGRQELLYMFGNDVDPLGNRVEQLPMEREALVRSLIRAVARYLEKKAQ